MTNQYMPVILNLIAAVFGALGQYAYKKGGLRLSEVPIWQNYHIWIGVLLFCAVMVLFVIGYKLGGQISVVYPFYATTFIWGALVGHFLDKEPISFSVIGGTILIVLGLVWIAQSIRTA